MSTFNPQIHHRRSIRLKGYDYSSKGLYFVTLIVKDRKKIFGKIADGKMHLNALGQIVEQEWLNTAGLRQNISLGAFVIMPDHFHAIISMDRQVNTEQVTGAFKSPSETVGAIIRGFKAATTRTIKKTILESSNIPNADQKIPNADQKIPNADQKIPKIIVSRININKPIWHRNYHDIIIRDEQTLNNITQYIINNPSQGR